MCNLYSITTNQAAIAALLRVVNRYVRNLARCRMTRSGSSCAGRQRGSRGGCMTHVGIVSSNIQRCHHLIAGQRAFREPPADGNARLFDPPIASWAVTMVSGTLTAVSTSMFDGKDHR